MSDRTFERAVSDWLDDGSDRTPRRAIDAVLLAVKTTPQERDLRIPWRSPLMPTFSRATGIAAVALVAAIGAGGLIYLLGSPPGGGDAPSPVRSPSPAAAPSSAAARVPPMAVSFTSPSYGYAIRYPADWTATAANVPFDPENPETGEGEPMDVFVPTATDGLLRIASVLVPATVDDPEAWIWELYGSCDATCQSSQLEPMLIDGQAGKLRIPGEMEAIVIVDDRAYVFTLFPGPRNGLQNLEGYWAAFIATVDLRPADAVELASPSPS